MMWYYTESKTAKIGLATMFSMLTAIDIIGNVIVCVLIVKFKDMRIPMNYLIMNLAVADILVALFIVPRFVLFDTYTLPDGMTGTVICQLLIGGNLSWIGAVASAFTLAVVALERYYAIMNPQGTQLTAAKVEIIVPVIWLFAILFNLPLLLTDHYSIKHKICMDNWPEEWMAKSSSMIWLLVTGYLPIFLMIGLSARVVYQLWFLDEDDGDSTRQGVLRIRRRITKMVFTVSVVFAVCRTPAQTMYVISYFSQTQYHSDLLHIISVAVVTANSAINPLIYVIANHRFRQHIKELICCPGLCRAKVDAFIPGQDNTQDATYTTEVVQLQQTLQQEAS